jgi:hypothetical protein
VAIPPSDGRALTIHFISESDCAFAHMKLRRRVGDRGALRIFDSVLRMVCWSRNTKALHLVKQRGALQAKSGSCSSRTSELPIGALASSQSFSAYLVFEGGV